MFERLEKMDRRTLAAIAIAVIVSLLLFGAITSGIRQAGWNEGFLVGLLSSAGGESGEALHPYLAARGHRLHGWHPFWLIGGFFRFLFFGFLILLLFKFFAFRRWARHGRHHWGDHGRQHWGDHGGYRGEERPWGPPNAEQPQPSQDAPQEEPPRNVGIDETIPNPMRQPQNSGVTQV